MSARRTTTVAALAVAGCALAGALGSGTAYAHGSMQNPLSRVEGCYLEGPEQPKSDACKAAVSLGGTQAMYDWNGVRIGDADGQHRRLIPDGRLCSANNTEFAGLDLPRADWPATNLTSGADFTFRFRATAPHRGTFQLFITNSSYRPSQPLSWSDLEPTPFLTITDPQLVDGQYVLPGKIPAGRTGRQLIYAIWQRSDSPEAFYSCSDVVFDGSGSAAGTAALPASDSGVGHVHDSPAANAAAPAAVPAAAVNAQAQAPAAAAAAAPAAGTRARATEQLAQTGTDRATGMTAAVGASFVLAGGTVAYLNRRRRAAGNHAR
ncbi:lytic polysaccharide monooxygenase [Kitasatospora sp. GP82]|uniref:lytic polysaccharide monooxygenase auxiliary activity family 9 protein n=1 Tax=Kitasatospora sp. GP82 TaxID=3035089 RepID=UPI0024746261|nr:lytic polysaccharide monooxygenase [Kitasatospora sp. GP82]MDH6126607.1 chitin-binding protein [Kitasatospora sp. GP82]